MTTSMNERTHFFIKIYLSHFILERVDVGCVWEMSWRRGQTAILIPNSSDHTSNSSSSWLGCSTMGHWGTQGPQSASWFSRWHLVPNWLQLAQTASGTWLYNCLTFTCFRLFTLVHLLVDGSIEGQYVTMIDPIRPIILGPIIWTLNDLKFFSLWTNTLQLLKF